MLIHISCQWPSYESEERKQKCGARAYGQIRTKERNIVHKWFINWTQQNHGEGERGRRKKNGKTKQSRNIRFHVKRPVKSTNTPTTQSKIKFIVCLSVWHLIFVCSPQSQMFRSCFVRSFVSMIVCFWDSSMNKSRALCIFFFLLFCCLYCKV